MGNLLVPRPRFSEGKPCGYDYGESQLSEQVSHESLAVVKGLGHSCRCRADLPPGAAATGRLAAVIWPVNRLSMVARLSPDREPMLDHVIRSPFRMTRAGKVISP